MFRRRRRQQLDLSAPDESATQYGAVFDEDQNMQKVQVGKRYLFGNIVVIEYADSLRASEDWMSMEELDREVIR